MNKKRLMRKLFYWLFYSYTSLVILIFLSFILSFMLGETSYRCLPKLQVPFGQMEGIAVNEKGEIFCGISMFSRIQKYDKEGNFIKGWFVPDPGICLFINEEGNLSYLATRQNKEFVYDSNDNIIKQYEVTDEYIAEKPPEKDFETVDKHGNIYQIKSKWFFPKIVKITPSGEKSVLISEPVYLTPLRFPFPSLLIIAILGFILKIIEHGEKKERNKEIEKSGEH